MPNLTVFDPTTQNRKTIGVTHETSIIIQDLDSVPDYFVKLTTAAQKINSDDIPTHVIRTLSDGAGTNGTVQHDGSAVPYATLSDAIADHVRRMVEGDLVDPDTAMDF